MSNGNKNIDKIESGFAMPNHPNDEILWINTQSGTVNVYNENSQEWDSVSGNVDFVVGSSNARTGTGEVLQFTDETRQSILTGPSPTETNSTAQRLVVAGQDGLDNTSGEGGDIYLWAGVGGSGNGSGGDIKVDAGNGGGTTGGGGTVKVRGGDSQDSSGGYVRIEGGYSANGYGGDVRLYGGDSNVEPGGDIEMYAGYSSASVGGNVIIQAGGSSTGIGGDINLTTYTDGKINLKSDGGIAIKDSNNDDLIFFERTGTGTARIGTPQDDLSLRSARDITLIAGDDGPGNVYIGWGDANITGDSSNKVATLGDLAYTRVNVPASSVGAEGDVAHLVADDTTHHYFCTGTWDGATNIWKRIEWSVDTWGV